jgi:hypothetical protein
MGRQQFQSVIDGYLFSDLRSPAAGIFQKTFTVARWRVFHVRHDLTS